MLAKLVFLTVFLGWSSVMSSHVTDYVRHNAKEQTTSDTQGHPIPPRHEPVAWDSALSRLFPH